MKKNILRMKSVSLDLDEMLIALGISATTNPAAQAAVEHLTELCGVRVPHHPPAHGGRRGRPAAAGPQRHERPAVRHAVAGHRLEDRARSAAMKRFARLGPVAGDRHAGLQRRRGRCGDLGGGGGRQHRPLRLWARQCDRSRGSRGLALAAVGGSSIRGRAAHREGGEARAPGHRPYLPRLGRLRDRPSSPHAVLE